MLEHLNIARYLVEHGADVNLQDTSGSTALMYATGKEYMDCYVPCIVTGLKDTSDDCIQIVSEDRFDVVKGMIEQGIDINVQDPSGSTALMYTTLGQRFDIVQLLVEHNVHVNIQNSYGKTALMYAAHDCLDLVIHLVRWRARINVQNTYGHTALMISACNDAIDTVKFLIKQGADINIRDNNGKTALMCAAERDHFGMVKYLTESQGHTLDMYLAHSDRKVRRMVKRLIQESE